MNGLKVGAIVLCAGSGQRAGLLHNKIFYAFGQRSLPEMVVDSFNAAGIDNILLVVRDGDQATLDGILAGRYKYSCCTGGATRTQSVRNGLNNISNCDIVVIHDCARAFVTPELIRACVESAAEHGSGVAAVRSTDTIKETANGFIERGLRRDNLVNVQTPQAFRYGLIKAAYDSIPDGQFTDDSEVLGIYGHKAHVVDGDYGNTKITTPEDLYGVRHSGIKIGTGFDVHQFKEGRRLILGGEDIPFRLGLDGHSDADVLVHAIMDALLSAAGLPDIGVLFPDNDKSYKDINSILLLENVRQKLCGFKILSISCVIMAQAPKLAGYIQKMRDNISLALGIENGRINVSATTTEFLGIVGECKGMAASAVCILECI